MANGPNIYTLNAKTSAVHILGIMRKLKFSFSLNALNQIYFSYILPVLECAIIVWDGCAAHSSDTLEKKIKIRLPVLSRDWEHMSLWTDCVRKVVSFHFLKEEDSKTKLHVQSQRISMILCDHLRETFRIFLFVIWTTTQFHMHVHCHTSLRNSVFRQQVHFGMLLIITFKTQIPFRLF